MSLDRIPILGSFLKGSRRLYDWTLSLAEKPQGTQALFGLSFIESSFFPLPPDPLLMAMGAAQPKRAIYFAAITTIASVLGALGGYFIGAVLMESVGEPLLNVYDAERITWNKILDWYNEYGIWALFLSAITPIPFKVFTIASGAMGIQILPFIMACTLGRGVRFFIEGILVRFFGAPIITFIDKWFNLASIAFAILFVAGFVILKYL